MIHDYTRKRGIVHSEILLPSNAPTNFQDRGTLWNSVEQIERACNSQLARELEVAVACVVNVEVCTHSSGNKLRGTVRTDKPYLFLSG